MESARDFINDQNLTEKTSDLTFAVASCFSRNVRVKPIPTQSAPSPPIICGHFTGPEGKYVHKIREQEGGIGTSNFTLIVDDDACT